MKKIAESTSHNFLIKIDSISFDQIPEKLKKIEFPNEGIIEINEDFLKIKITSLNFELICMKYDDTVPKISMIRKSNNIFEILFDSHNSVKLSAKNNIERDIIAMTLRMISGEKILGKSEQKQDETRIKILNEAKCLSATLKTNSKRRNSIENYSFLIKVEQLTNEVSRHLNEKQTLKNELVELKERIKELENNNKRLTDQLDITTKNYKDIDQENEDLKQKMEIFISQKHFFLQEIDIYKAESSSKDDIIDKMKKEMNKLMPSNPNKEKLTWVEVEDLKKNTKDLTINISQIKKEKSEINEKNEKNEEIIEELSKKQEDMANEINYLRKKCESLAQEKGLTFNTPKKIDTFESLEMKNETFSNSNQKIKENLKEKTKESSEESEKYGNSIILNKKNFPSALTGIEEENRKLKDQIKQFEITIET